MLGRNEDVHFPPRRSLQQRAAHVIKTYYKTPCSVSAFINEEPVSSAARQCALITQPVFGRTHPTRSWAESTATHPPLLDKLSQPNVYCFRFIRFGFISARLSLGQMRQRCEHVGIAQRKHEIPFGAHQTN